MSTDQDVFDMLQESSYDEEILSSKLIPKITRDVFLNVNSPASKARLRKLLYRIHSILNSFHILLHIALALIDGSDILPRSVVESFSNYDMSVHFKDVVKGIRRNEINLVPKELLLPFEVFQGIFKHILRSYIPSTVGNVDQAGYEKHVNSISRHIDSMQFNAEEDLVIHEDENIEAANDEFIKNLARSPTPRENPPLTSISIEDEVARLTRDAGKNREKFNDEMSRLIEEDEGIYSDIQSDGIGCDFSESKEMCVEQKNESNDSGDLSDSSADSTADSTEYNESISLAALKDDPRISPPIVAYHTIDYHSKPYTPAVVQFAGSINEENEFDSSTAPSTFIMDVIEEESDDDAEVVSINEDLNRKNSLYQDLSDKFDLDRVYSDAL